MITSQEKCPQGAIYCFLLFNTYLENVIKHIPTFCY